MKINDYANSMFRYETITNIWIEKCTNYLIHIFGDTLKDKVILDYAFGRGNWSLAFLRAGAKKVISVDASKDNVQKFNNYLKVEGINDIEIIHGNFLIDTSYSFKIDIFWIYGILQHLEDDMNFLKNLKKFENKNSFYYIYAYPKNSLRYFLVNNCRKLIKYKSEKHYIKNSFYYIKEAQMRVRDDYTAPYIKWYSYNILKNIVKELNLNIHSTDIDFYEFLHQKKNFEFNPIQIKCSQNKNSIKLKKEQKLKELKILNKLFDEIFIFMKRKSFKFKESFVIGLTNTYYSSIQHNSQKLTIEKIFIYLISTIFTLNIKCKDQISKEYIKLLNDSIKDNKKRKIFYKELGHNILTELLIENKIRL